jgi:cytochrome c553
MSKRFLSISFLLTLVFLTLAAMMAMPVQAAGDAENGAALATACMGCHGIPGYRNAYPSYRVPKLGGQHEEYLALGLKGYQVESRAHLTMQAQAADLSEQDIHDLSAYFSAQGELSSGSAKSSARIGRGKEKSATCTACHGEAGISSMPNWPILAGQHEDYLKQALHQYKIGNRKDPVMAGQVVNLTEEDIKDLAAYFAAQPGLASIN